MGIPPLVPFHDSPEEVPVRLEKPELNLASCLRGLLFRFEKKRIDADLHIEFLEQIRQRHRNRKVIVVEDQARPHIARKVGEYVDRHKKSFALYYLPPYSPELNPDENVWHTLKIRG